MRSAASTTRAHHGREDGVAIGASSLARAQRRGRGRAPPVRAPPALRQPRGTPRRRGGIAGGGARAASPSSAAGVGRSTSRVVGGHASLAAPPRAGRHPPSRRAARRRAGWTRPRTPASPRRSAAGRPRRGRRAGARGAPAACSAAARSACAAAPSRSRPDAGARRAARERVAAAANRGHGGVVGAQSAIPCPAPWAGVGQQGGGGRDLRRPRVPRPLSEDSEGQRVTV